MQVDPPSPPGASGPPGPYQEPPYAAPPPYPAQPSYPRYPTHAPYPTQPPYPLYPPYPPYPPTSRAAAPGGSPWAVLAAVLVGLWAVAVTVGGQGIAWLIDQVLLATGSDPSGWLWPVVTLVNAVAAGVPAVLVATLPRSVAVRTAGRVWLIAGAALALFGLLRAIPMPHHEVYLAVLAGTAVLAALPLRRIPPPRERVSAPAEQVAAPAEQVAAAEPSPTARGIGPPSTIGAAVGLILLLPWAWIGALGGVLETALAAIAAAAVGRLVAVLLDGRFWAAYRHDAAGRPVSPVRAVLLGGLVAGVALALLSAGVGQAGTHLALLLVLPPAGFALAALVFAGATAGQGAERRRTGVGWLVAIGVFGPLAFADPEEISLLLATGRDIPFWVLVASGAGLGVALLLGTALLLGVALPTRPSRAANPPAANPTDLATGPADLATAPTDSAATPASPRRRLAGAVVVALLLAVGAVHVLLGQPGWHGEPLFVVLKEQADLTGIAAAGTGSAARDARARAVHRRLVDTAERSQADLRRDLARLRLDYRPYYLVNAVEVRGGLVVRQWLSRRGDVDRVLLGQGLRPLPAPLTTTTGAEPAPGAPPWNITMIGADRVRAEFGVTGAGVVVGSSDSGVDGSHPALASGFRGGEDSWFDPWNAARSPADHSGHGTHTLATAVGGQQVGVAPGARWVGCVNLDRNLGNPGRYLDCLQFMLAPFPAGGDPFTDGRPERAPHVLTNSWGCPPIEGCDQEVLRPAVAALTAAGIFFVAAAGNTGPSCGSVDDPPAPYPDVLTVGAVDRGRQVTDFSSRGPTPGGLVKPDLVAPGAAVLSAMPGGGYAELDGTSMAAPHLAGVVALMWSANPALIGDLERTRRVLRDTATEVPAPRGDDGGLQRCGSGTGTGTEANLAGAGLVDAYAAVRAVREAGRGG